VAQEGELLVSPAFFHGLVQAVPRLTSVRSRLKGGRDRNEMTRYRYDIVLGVGAAPGAVVRAPAHVARDVGEIRALLAARPDAVRVTDLLNARLSAEVAAATEVDAGVGTAAEHRARIAAGGPGFDPDSLGVLDADYDVEVSFARSGAPDRFDALFRRRASAALPAVDEPLPDAAAPTTNEPVRDGAAAAAGGAADWRRLLREQLPEYMVPSLFVELAAMPLTPNGKIDRRALSVPAAPVAAPAASYRAPATDVERVVADVWKSLLGTDRVGADDNIFDLGANSLLTVQACGQIGRELGRTVSLVSMFQFPTVRRLAEHLADAAPSTDAGGAGRERANTRLDAMARRRAARAGRDAE
jgi:acyl carrier protein